MGGDALGWDSQDDLGEHMSPLENVLGDLALDDSVIEVRDNVATATARLEAIRDRLPPALNGDGGSPVHVQNPTDVSALATNATLASVLTELAQKVEPADLASLAQEGTLSILSGKVGVPSSDDLLTLLREIRTNTATEITRTETLELTADQIQLNTDAVEAKLDTVSNRIGTTGVAGTVAALLDAIRLNQVNQAVQATVTNPFNGDITDRVGRLLGHVAVDNWPATQAISAAALPLPAGAATDSVLQAVRDRIGDTAAPAAGSTHARLEQIRALLAGTLTTNTEFSEALGANAGTLSQAGDSLIVSGSGNALDSTPIPSTDVRAYRWLSVQITGTFVGTYIFEVSNNNVDWVTQSLSSTTNVAEDAPTNAWTAPLLFQGPVVARYFRVRINPYTSGAVNVTAVFSALPGAPPVQMVDTGLPKLVAASAIADAASLNNALPVGKFRFNNTTWDKERTNVDGTALASAARTATTSSPDIVNYNGDGIFVILRVSAIGTAPSLVVTVEGKDPVSGLYFALNVNPAAVIAVGTYVYEVGEGASGAAGGGVTQRTAGQLPRVFRVTVTHGNANSVTYSVGYSLISA